MKPLLKEKPDEWDELYGRWRPPYKPPSRLNIFFGYVWGMLLIFGLVYAFFGLLLRLL